MTINNNLNSEITNAYQLLDNLEKKLNAPIGSIEVYKNYQKLLSNCLSTYEKALSERTVSTKNELTSLELKIEKCLKKLKANQPAEERLKALPDVPKQELALSPPQKRDLRDFNELRRQRDTVNQKLVELHSSLRESNIEKKRLEKDMQQYKVEIDTRERMLKSGRTFSGPLSQANRTIIQKQLKSFEAKRLDTLEKLSLVNQKINHAKNILTQEEAKLEKMKQAIQDSMEKQKDPEVKYLFTLHEGLTPESAIEKLRELPKVSKQI